MHAIKTGTAKRILVNLSTLTLSAVSLSLIQELCRYAFFKLLINLFITMNSPAVPAIKNEVRTMRYTSLNGKINVHIRRSLASPPAIAPTIYNKNIKTDKTKTPKISRLKRLLNINDAIKNSRR